MNNESRPGSGGGTAESVAPTGRQWRDAADREIGSRTAFGGRVFARRRESRRQAVLRIITGESGVDISPKRVEINPYKHTGAKPSQDRE